MKKLSHDELAIAPAIVSEIYANSVQGIPNDPKVVEQAIKDYPDYFPQEIEFNKKWEAVPGINKARYYKALSNLEKKELKNFKLRIKRVLKINALVQEEVDCLPSDDKENYYRFLQRSVDYVEKEKKKLYDKHLAPYLKTESKLRKI